MQEERQLNGINPQGVLDQAIISQEGQGEQPML
jgi:hypothetical protein